MIKTFRLQNDLLKLASDDVFGQKLKDLDLPGK
jgi:hypothetical protein